MTLFESFHPTLQDVLISGLGWGTVCLRFRRRPAMRFRMGADVVVLAPTAEGKTESAFIPVIYALLKSGRGGIVAVYISPLKALINDQEDRVRGMCTRAGLTVASQHGDVASRDRWAFSPGGERLDLLLTTPESLEVLLGDPDARGAFSRLRFVIIDEIHAFMETDRGVHLRCLLDRLEFSGKIIQRIGLSATVGNPEQLLDWLSAPKRKKRNWCRFPHPQRRSGSFLWWWRSFPRRCGRLRMRSGEKKALVFVDSRSFAERLMTPLSDLTNGVHIHHSSVLAEDRAGGGGGVCAGRRGPVVICTSTMELGVDIGDLDVVVQYGPPRSVSSFLQRLGRTGRRGKPAAMTFILQRPCDLLVSAATIESAMDRAVEPLAVPCRRMRIMFSFSRCFFCSAVDAGVSGERRSPRPSGGLHRSPRYPRKRFPAYSATSRCTST